MGVDTGRDQRSILQELEEKISLGESQTLFCLGCGEGNQNCWFQMAKIWNGLVSRPQIKTQSVLMCFLLLH